MKPKSRLLAVLLLPLALGACCTTDADCSRNDVMGAINNAIAAASTAVGAASVAVGLKTGNPSLASSGGDLLVKAGDMVAKPSADTPAANGGAGPVPASSSASAPAQQTAGAAPEAGASCVSYLRRQRLGYMREAARCQANAQFMSSMENEAANPLPTVQCGGSYNQINQRIAQEACGQVYACATLAYTVALSAAKNGAQCEAAVREGLRRYPIPSVN